ncbi:uncharacterized protein LOC119672536 [Teleopsis dalmanni]|uniref:uncharacterized protein LOC119672536 n=1 Tax=Teleopsis dalmanni TaxID=139649 RepID=UPI0018CFB27E|nr:uncharacterized protein LOC119672536 [Teleopsis dalmanni]
MSNVSEKFCRICYGGSEYEALSMPCKCSGSMESVHEYCLKSWLKNSRKLCCELCKYNYKIRLTFRQFSNPLLIACVTLFRLLCLLLSKIQSGFSIIMITLMRILLLAQTYRIYETLFENIFIKKPSREICIVLEALLGIPITIIARILFLLLLNSTLTAIEKINGLPDREIFRRNILLLKQTHSSPAETSFIYFAINVFVIYVLICFPFLIGYFILSSVHVVTLADGSNMLASIVICLFGYFVIIAIFEPLQDRLSSNLVDYTYITIKSLFYYLMIFFTLPLFIGFWLDVCSLPFYSRSFDVIYDWHSTNPMQSIIFHWILGAVFASLTHLLVLYLRRTLYDTLLRKILWFNPRKLSFKKHFERDSLSTFALQFIRVLVFHCITAIFLFGVPTKVLLMFNIGWDKKIRFIFQILVYYGSLRSIMYTWTFYSFKLFDIHDYLLPEHGFGVNTDLEDVLENFLCAQPILRTPRNIPDCSEISFLYCRIIGLYLIAIISSFGPFLVGGFVSVIVFSASSILNKYIYYFIISLYLGYKKLQLLIDIVLFGQNSAFNFLIVLNFFTTALTLSSDSIAALFNSWYDIVIAPLKVIPEPLSFISWKVFMAAFFFVGTVAMFKDRYEWFMRNSFGILRRQYLILCIMPYALAHSIVPLLVHDYNQRTHLLQNFYLYYIALYKLLQCVFILQYLKTKFQKYYEEVKIIDFSQDIHFDNYNENEEVEGTDRVMVLTNAPTKLIYKFFRNIL